VTIAIKTVKLSIKNAKKSIKTYKICEKSLNNIKKVKKKK
jgi:hypothetical protein